MAKLRKINNFGAYPGVIKDLNDNFKTLDKNITDVDSVNNANISNITNQSYGNITAAYEAYCEYKGISSNTVQPGIKLSFINSSNVLKHYVYNGTAWVEYSIYLKDDKETLDNLYNKLNNDPVMVDGATMVLPTITNGESIEVYGHNSTNDLTHLVICKLDNGNANIYMNAQLSSSDEVLEGTIDEVVALFIKHIAGVRTFNYVVGQSDVDMLYNQGRVGDVKLGDEWRSEFQNVNITPYIEHINNDLGNAECITTATSISITKAGTNEHRPSISYRVFNEQKRRYFLLTIELLCEVSVKVGIWDGISAINNRYDLNPGINKINIDTLNIRSITMYINGSILQTINVIDIVGYDKIVLNEHLQSNIYTSRWANTGVNTADLIFTNPSFIKARLFEDIQYGTVAPVKAPVALGQQYMNTATSKLYVCCGKANNAQYTNSDWIIQN